MGVCILTVGTVSVGDVSEEVSINSLPGGAYQTLLQVTDVLLRPNHNKIPIDSNEVSESLFGSAPVYKAG